ncbi:MAG: tetratricopeptide repeat protein [Thermodesulfobacteriota bacterium]
MKKTLFKCLMPTLFMAALLFGAVTAVKAEEAATKAEEVPANIEESPAKAEEVPAKAEEVPATIEEVPAKAEEVPVKSIGEIELCAARAAVKSDFAEALKYCSELTGSSYSTGKFMPFMAYVAWKAGDSALALKLLEGRTDEYSGYVLRMVNPSAIIPGAKAGVKDVLPFFIKTTNKNGSISLGVLPKAVEKAALQRAFYAVAPEPDVKQVALFNDKVLAFPEAYFLGGEVLTEDDGEVICMAFVDVGAVRGVVAASKPDAKTRVGVLMRKGSDKSRKYLIAELSSRGYVVEDLGRGDFYALGEKAGMVAVVIEAFEEPKVSEGVLGSKFKNIETPVTLTIYNAATGKVATELKGRSSMVHISEEKGIEISTKKSYEKLYDALNFAILGMEKDVKGFASGLPPLEVAIKTIEVFSSSYKAYAKNPAGEIILKNNTPKPFGSVKVSISIKDYTDYPTQLEVGELPSGGTITKPVNIVFNGSVVNITDDTFVQSEVKVTYFDAGVEKTVIKTHPIYVYEKHALVWDDKGKIASFITPKDPVVSGFATSAAGGYRAAKLNKNMVKARAVFAAMGVLGLEYMEDPNNPYSVVYGLTNVVDFVQFPRETLSRKVGDCDDLTSLYSSALESLGVKTKLLDAPGHIYMMFDTEIPESRKAEFAFPEKTYILFNGTIWIPVETTLVGSSFTEAWKKAVENYAKEKNKTKIIDLSEAMQIYKAPNLPPALFKDKVSKEDIEKRFPNELEKLEKERASYVASGLEEGGYYGLMELMEFYASEGMLDKAIEVSKKLLDMDKNALLLNNAGNVHFLKKDYDTAIKYYKEASLMEPDDAGTYVNLARAHLKKKAKREAKAAFEKAMSIDPKVKETYGGIYAEIKK